MILGKDRQIIIFVASLFVLAAMLTAIGLVSAAHYQKAHTRTYYEVMEGEHNLGLVSSPKVVEQYIDAVQEKLQKDQPGVSVVLEYPELSYREKQIYNGSAEDQKVMKKLDSLISYHVTGIALTVDGQTVGIVKNQAEADQILDQIKAPYTLDSQQEMMEKGDSVRILSSEDETDPADVVLSQTAGFVQEVNTMSVDTRSNQFSTPGQILKKLRTGEIKPMEYKVKKGDCISCIASRFNISEQVIYNNNDWIKNDMLRIGDVLDIAVYKPMLSVKTVDQVKETVPIPIPKEYEKTDQLLKGVVQTVRSGKEGKKTQIVQLTKVDGIVQSREVISEKVITEPVPAKYLQGTKVISGLGTGHFTWPVTHPRLTRGFGWQKAIFVKPNADGNEYHEGLDIVSSTGSRNILAADTGKVIFRGWINGYGNVIKIDHLNGYVSFYGHLNKFYVKKGQIVEKGQRIAYMGQTGWATGVHVHFGLYHYGKLVNPANVLN